MPQQQRIGKTHTTVVDNTDQLVVTYHATQVVRVNKRSGIVTLNSGGWKTATTKNRMNQTSNQFQLNFGVSQKSGVWYVDCKGKTVEFFDGMKFNPFSEVSE